MQPRLGEAYVARIDDPRDETPEQKPSRFVVIRQARDEDGVVAVIDFVRPDRPLAGRIARDGRLRAASLTEIDLFAAGLMRRVGSPARHGAIVTRPCGERAGTPMAFDLRAPLPTIRIPLGDGEAAVTLDLQPLVDQAYVGGGYDGNLDYQTPPTPSLAPDDEAWADALLRAAGKRA